MHKHHKIIFNIEAQNKCRINQEIKTEKKTTLPSIRNQDKKKAKIEIEKINELMPIT